MDGAELGRRGAEAGLGGGLLLLSALLPRAGWESRASGPRGGCTTKAVSPRPQSQGVPRGSPQKALEMQARGH